MSKNLTHLSNKNGNKENLFVAIQQAAFKKGSPSKDSIHSLAKDYLIGDANVLGSSSFYDFLKKENEGKNVYIRNGTACLLAGTQTAVKAKLLEKYKESEIGEVCCLGHCHENAAFQIDQTNYSGRAIDQLTELDNYTGDDYYVAANCEKPVMITSINYQSIYDLYFELLKSDKESLLEEIEISRLRGRGGAGFPMALKMTACMQAEALEKFIVCNADEGDPGSYSDRYLLEHHPHLILFGMMVSGYICGAEQGILYIRAEYPASI